MLCNLPFLDGRGLNAARNFLLLGFLSCLFSLSLFSQENNSESSDTKANQIIDEYHRAINYQIPKPPETIFLQYKEVWKANKTEVSSSKCLYSSGTFLRSEDRNTPGSATFSRIAILNDRVYHREYSTAVSGSSIKDLDFLKPGTENESEVKLIKREAFTIVFPLTLEAPWYKLGDLKFIGIAQTGSRKAWVLETNRGPNTNIKLLFDTESKLLTMWKYTVVSSDGKSHTYDYYFYDYKEFAAGKFPSLIQVFEDEQSTMRYEIVEFQRKKSDDHFFNTLGK